MNKEDLYNKGAELYKNERYAEAIEALLNAHVDDPRDTDVIVLLAGCYIGICHFTEAVRLLLIADNLNKNDPAIKYNLGYALLCMGRLNDAIKCIKECLRLDPPKEIKEMATRMIESEDDFKRNLDNNFNISLEEEFECSEKFQMAQNHLYNSDFEEAIDIYKLILKKKPGFHQAIQNIGVCYIKNGKPKEAINYLEKALAISPKDDLCLGNLAHAYYLLGDFERSEEFSKRAIEAVNQPLLRDLLRLVTLFIEISQFEFARKLLDRHGNDYKNAQLTFLSGVIYAKQKEYAAAKKEFQSIRKYSRLATEYFEKTEQILNGDIKEYDFEPRMAVGAGVDMI